MKKRKEKKNRMGCLARPRHLDCYDPPSDVGNPQVSKTSGSLSKGSLSLQNLKNGWHETSEKDIFSTVKTVSGRAYVGVL